MIEAQARRVGLIGDVHAEHRRLDVVLGFFAGAGIDTVCCTGDLADGVGDVDACCNLLADAGALAVAGNHDRWLLGNRMRSVPHAHRLSDLDDASHGYIASLPPTRTVQTPLGPALLCHGVGENDMRKVWPGSVRMPIERSPELDGLIARGETRFVINGHLHYRIIVNFDELTLLNAGTLKGDHRPGVSILDFDAGIVSAFEFDANLALHRVAERPIQDEGRRIWRNTQEFDSGWTPVTLYAA